MGEALRSNLSEALADKLDQEILAGGSGLLHGTILANHAAAAITSYAHYRSELAYGRVDGTFAGSVSELKIVMGAALMATRRRAIPFHQRWRPRGARRPDASHRRCQSVGSCSRRRLGQQAERRDPPWFAPRDFVAPIWEGVTLIPDEITKAGAGQIVITAVMLYSVKLLRAEGFYKQQTQHA